MTVAFLGLTGPQGVLPYHYTELLIERRRRYNDRTAHDFFDLFGHRLVSLFYQAWEKYHFWVAHERGDHAGFLAYLLSFVGLGSPGLQGRLSERDEGFGDETVGFYSGILSQRPASATSLAAVVGDVLGCPAAVESFRGCWLILSEHHRTRLGRESRNNRLGDDVVIGDRVWDRQSSFRLVLGPLRRATFEALLPHRPLLRAVARFVRFHVGMALMFDIQLVLRRQEVPRCLVRSGDQAAARLGWSSWLLTAAADRDRGDAVFTVALEGG
jgi:type VI secretion system protein ImpH